MRGILFRGKRVDPDGKGRFVEGWLFMYEGALCIQTLAEPECGEFIFQVDPETVGQYTGRLADFCLERIFEGDIVKVSTLFETPFIGAVCFLDCKFCIVDTNSTVHYRWMDYDIEVIGNIYDNFELLKGEIRE